MKGSNGQNPHTTREKLPTNRKGPHLIFAVLSFESYCTLICKHKKTNSIQTFIQSIKDVAHHHIVKESKEKADNDDSESKAPDENDKWEKGRYFLMLLTYHHLAKGTKWPNVLIGPTPAYWPRPIWSKLGNSQLFFSSEGNLVIDSQFSVWGSGGGVGG